jgi:tRNA threonylcarbamoyladenosine biosynthesis protein TsaB
MRVLALDTTTRAGSVALVDDGGVVDERSGDASRTHAERLPQELLALLAAHRLTASAVDVFAVACGPGSFTGLRVGIATMQGLAFVERKPVAAVSALRALGQLGSLHARPGDLVAAWMDAHRREVFSALFRVADGQPFEPDRLDEIEGPAVGDPAATLERWRPARADAPVVFVGDGAVLYAATIETQRPLPSRILGPPPLLAGAIGRMGLLVARANGACDPGAVQPLYVRRPDAEIAREASRRARAECG